MPRAPHTPPSEKHASTDRSEPKGGRARARGKPRRPTKSESLPEFALGARVRIVDGPFAGKVGVVQGVDAKGGARVMLGLLVVRFEVRHLTLHAEGRARPVLGSSHRKPGAARS